jgi:UDP-GlcNAc:undecaprenyl-phosphate GlcNAc-1-phosphate transferase
MLGALLLPLAALPVTAALTWTLARARPGRALAEPTEDRWHTRPTPTLGGVAILTGCAVAVAALAAAGALPLDAQIAGLLGGAAIVFSGGLADDLRPLPAWLKLGLQLAAVACVVATGSVVAIIENDWLAYPLTVVWLVGMTNAFNLLDNMDGLAGSVALVSAGLFAASGFLQDETVVVALAAAVACGCLGFLPFNVPPGRPAAIFMGDSGSQLLGLSLGTIALLSNWRGASNVIVALFVPFLLLAVPIMDTALVTLVRLRERRPVHLGGKDHSSHRLVGHGLSERRAVLVLAGLGATLGGMTLALVEIDRPFLTITGAALAVAVLARFGLFLAGLQREDRAPRPNAPVVHVRRFVLYRRQLVEMAVDSVLVVGAYSLAHAVRFEGWQEDSVWRGGTFHDSWWIVLGAQLAAFVGFRLYRGIWKHAGFRDVLAVAYAVATATTIVVAALALAGSFDRYSRSVFLVYGVLCVAFVAASRLGERWIEEILTSVRGAAGSRRVLIVGAGRAGIALLRELRETPGHVVTGFLDDDPAKQGMRIQRVPILGSCWNAREAIERTRADLVVVTIPRAPRETLTHVVSVCDEKRIACRFALRDHDLDPAQFLERRGAAPLT